MIGDILGVLGNRDEFINDDGDYEWVDPFLTFTKE
jgi:hypothetical protein